MWHSGSDLILGEAMCMELGIDGSFPSAQFSCEPKTVLKTKFATKLKGNL